MGAWKLIIELFLPIPLILLTLLCIPAPRKFHRGVLKLVDRTLGVSFINNQFSLLHVALIITGTAFLGTIHETQRLSRERSIIDNITPNVAAGNLGKKWRAERNFWISFICFVLWCLLARIYQLLLVKTAAEDELRALRSGTTGRPAANGAGPAIASASAASAPTRPEDKKAT